MQCFNTVVLIIKRNSIALFLDFVIGENSPIENIRLYLSKRSSSTFIDFPLQMPLESIDRQYQIAGPPVFGISFLSILHLRYAFPSPIFSFSRLAPIVLQSVNLHLVAMRHSCTHVYYIYVKYIYVAAIFSNL